MVAVDVADIGDRLAADRLGGRDLHVVEPHIGVEPHLFRPLPRFDDVARAGVVGREGEGVRSRGLSSGPLK